MNSIWNTSLNILARRDHSRLELKTKLSRRFEGQESEVEAVLARLEEAGLQSDEKFAELWFRSQIQKSRGPIRIKMEARQKGIEHQVVQLVQTSDVEWFELALNVVQRKFPDGISWDTKAKAYRFLAYRGFENDSIQYALQSHQIQPD